MDSQIPSSTSKTSDGQKVQRKRLRLSCGECRKKKVSSYSTTLSLIMITLPKMSMHKQQQAQLQIDSEEVQKLRSEVTQLRVLLSKIHSQNEATIVAEPVTATGVSEISCGPLSDKRCEETYGSIITTDNNLIHPNARTPSSYYTQHHLFRFFEEIPELFPFMKETREELLEPHGVRIKKDTAARNDLRAHVHCTTECQLEDFLPAKDVTDFLVLSYLESFEQLHRIVHIPTFNKEYAKFWVPDSTRHSAMTALILSMISISICIPATYNSLTPSHHQIAPRQWISACDRWLREQSSNGRKLVHYQIGCLLYLAKRMHMIRKKEWFKETSSLLQNAIMDGLHRDPTSSGDTIFTREMKRRIWAVIRELDLQNSFETGIPTLLNTIDAKTGTPGDIDDDEFDETSKILLISDPFDKHTRTSYQIHSSQSWGLRLDVSRRLFATGSPKVLSYDEVLHLTHQLTQEIHSLPAWDEVNSGATSHACYPIPANAFLHFQLIECSSSIIMSDSTAIINFLKRCLPTMGNRYLYGFDKEPWCFLTMSTAISLLNIHAGKVSPETGKLDISQSFSDLHHKRIENQRHISISIQQDSSPRISAEHINSSGQSAAYKATEFPAFSWLNDSDFENDGFDLGMDLDSMWQF
ncbi:putative c6 zinc finger domain-containing protein [Botrytis fragariae]|uniref:Putative c6 zinc finger domain-containing protein n=1 Tax=Botrytis fragariae TaxID=1964551 RepID=A0A8H6B2C3_9HELO|nr:putative c6 zinc finger domain-containing protein [Botrytis fragariae]KAF5877835.1 putative c6 zinc finger domain-containing protein [Botrytis fragariae]